MIGMRRRRPAPESFLPLTSPLPDGTGWPDRDGVPRRSFEARTYHELGLRNAYETEAHAIADRVAEDLLPMLDVPVEPVDEAFLHKVFVTATRVGAGIGMLARTLPPGPEGTVESSVAGALWLARDALPAMPGARADAGGWCLLAGFTVARGGPPEVQRLRGQLEAYAQKDPGA